MNETNGTRITRSRGEISAIRDEAALQRSLENACLVAHVCESYRGQETIVLDVTQVTPIFDFFVISTGNSRRQLRAMASMADDVIEERGSSRLSREGADVPWICHDYGDIVLHVFTPEARKQYDLENLWGDASRVDWQSIVEGLGVTTEATASVG